MVRPVHDRMPVILDSGDYELWLYDDLRKASIREELLRPFLASEMGGYQVSTIINSPQNQGSRLIERAAVNSA